MNKKERAQYEGYTPELNNEEHEAYGSMIHRQLVEKRTTRNYHEDIKRSMDLAVEALERITTIYFYDQELADGRTAWRMNEIGERALKEVKEIMR